MERDAAYEISSILQPTPNGVLLVDAEARVRFVNPSFRKIFHAGEGDLVGRKAAELLRSDCLERAIAAGGELSVRGSIPELDVHYRAGLFALEGEPRYCGIFIDTSEEEKAHAEVRELRRQTLERAQEVIGRQMKTAQEIAGLLGETTAETKLLLKALMDLFKEDVPE